MHGRSGDAPACDDPAGLDSRLLAARRRPRGARREWSLRVTRSGLSAEEVAAAAARLHERLADGPLRRREIDDLLGKPLAGAAGLWLDLVRVAPSGTWERRRADLYAAAGDWLERPR